MNWYYKNIEILMIMVAMIFILLVIVDVIWGRKSEKLPLSMALVPALMCLLGLIITLPAWFEAPEIFVTIISPGLASAWLGWVYVAKTFLAFLLIAPLLGIVGIVFMAKTFLPHTWMF